MDVTNPDDDRDETGYHSYLLRIWKTDQDAFKGYVIDPITRKTYPLVKIPAEAQRESSPITADCKGIWIETIGCWLGIWKPGDSLEDLT